MGGAAGAFASRTVRGFLSGPPPAPLTLVVSSQADAYHTFQLDAAVLFIERDAANWRQPIEVNLTVPENANVGEFRMGAGRSALTSDNQNSAREF
jgi:hypothetical protein